VADKPVPKAPSKMCKRCFDLWSTLKDVERPCRRAGCKGTWSDKRGAQLARHVRGKGGDPYPRYCTECEKELGDLDDREIACRTDGCPGTWTWSKEQQLAAGVRPKIKEPAPTQPTAEPTAAGAPESAPVIEVVAPVVAETTPVEAAPTTENAPAPVAEKPAGQPHHPGKGKKNRRRREPQPPERRCSACSEFLSGRKTQEIPCIQCATPIYWPPESQLQTHLGNWAAPALCGSCKLAQVMAAREAAREALRHPPAAHQPEPEATPPATPDPGSSE
jgi:hypothetical protein